ncbi:branched-chain amino acid ABC transporter substrate-binding protein [Pseudomonas taiwanensis]|uniref:cytochrome c/ABC transporter substrate-binding protein n=1 Tax=Pseudomonas taiwanensis TaxID=470150 RepID=UPI0015B81142|nr:ABC transporter substrate-binding protein [Pseudomonas taiwanensis]NWL77601.1 branched-chain amino acid ABC transporter substrate-binding protein [Pseudomonas taiwanensis]
MWRAVLLALLLALLSPAFALELSPEEAAGRRIYLEGVGAANGEISARVGAGDTLVPAAVMPCANCHGADGRGRPEGGVRPPDITWRRLSLPYGQLQANGRSHGPYDEGALARAVSEGRDPAGNRLDPAMPRFVMSLRDMANLTAYLKRLEDDRDPGVQETELRLGTLLPTRGPLAELGHTVEAVLRGALAQVNEAGGIHGRQLTLVVRDPGMDRQSTQRALDQLLGEDQVFALLAPLVPALDGDLSDAIGKAGVPLVGPLALFDEADDNRLVFNALPGLREQLFALARYASSDLGLQQPEALVVYPGEARQQGLAESLALRLMDQGWSRVRLLDYDSENRDRALGSAAKGAQGVFFLGQSDDFARLADQLQADDLSPYLFAASAQVASSALRIPPRFSERVFLAYPFMPADWTPEGEAALLAIRRSQGVGGQHAALQVGAYCAAMLVSEGLKRAGRDASREKLVSALEGLRGFHTGLTPALDFGPGQRVGLAGAHIVTVDLHSQNFRPLGRFIKVDTRL